MRIGTAVGGPSLEAYLLARHQAIDLLLERATEERGVGQVVETPLHGGAAGGGV